MVYAVGGFFILERVMGSLVWASDYDAMKQKRADWYDYKKRKGDIFPKAFDKVQFTHAFDCWINGEVIGMNSSGGCVIEYGADTYATIYREDKIRPMDWDKMIEIDTLAVMIDAVIMQSFDTQEDTAKSIAAAILAAGYRKCDNNTPPTKE